MSDGDAILDIGWHQWAGNICPVDFSIDRAESVLSWSAGWWFRSVGWWFHDFDGGSVMLTKIDGFHAPKIRFRKNYRGQSSRNAKNTQKNGFSGEIRRPRSLWSPATVGLLSLFGRRFSFLFVSSFCCIFLNIFLTYLTWFSWKKPNEKPCKSEHKVSYFLEKPKSL